MLRYTSISMAFSLLLRNRIFSSRIPFHIKPFIGASTFHTEGDFPKSSDPKSGLSARLSFVFDQIDAIEKDRNSKDEALQRIRSWRETKQKKSEDETGVVHSVELETMVKKKESVFKKEVEVVHPWPEWVEFMERLAQQNYFDPRKKDEDKIIQDLSIDVASFPEEGFDFSKDWIAVRTACLNFGRDRFDILRSLSRQDIQVLVGHGCPSTDKKVVFSGKMLRKHVHLDEGDVCSSCNMRSSCEKAYLLPPKEDDARTIDVLRILLTYGFDSVKGTVENKDLLKLKTVKTVVRKLLHEIVKLSAVPIDPNLSPPVFKKPPPKVKQPPPPPRRRVGRDDIEMKKGDWLCTKCDFMNFAKNTVCLQCDAKRPKRQLLPGEWECPECNFLNYRRNMACFHCDHKRPPDEFMENQKQERQYGPRTTLERVTDMPAGSNSWNFDFEDNESDGADVAAFEYADPPKMAEDSPIDSRARGDNFGEFEDDSFETSRIPGSNGRGRYSDPDRRKAPTGFDDFDDEEDDDINNYELEMPNNNSMHEPSRNFSEVEGHSGSEDFDASDHHSHRQRSANSSPRSKPLRSGNVDGFDSDEDPSVYSNWKSSHVGDSRNGVKARGRKDSYRKNAFGSDSELGIGSDSDGEYSHSGRSKAGPVRRGNTSRNHGQYQSGREEEFRPNIRQKDRRDTYGNADDGRPLRGFQRNIRESRGEGYSGGRNSSGKSSFERSSRGSFRNNREPNEDRYSGGRANDRRASMKNSDRGGGGPRNNGRSGGFNSRSDTGGDFGDDKPRRPRVNVR